MQCVLRLWKIRFVENSVCLFAPENASSLQVGMMQHAAAIQSIHYNLTLPAFKSLSKLPPVKMLLQVLSRIPNPATTAPGRPKKRGTKHTTHQHENPIPISINILWNFVRQGQPPTHSTARSK
ncbi:hypothetical protein EMCG_00442 [[Emmonsia] crescens]|uniref:Uncharacterized protein n=1 Tax=[Emmonsia] crescens TaxID=73230 RepID=A0A0G2HWW3_9EURO|nr:hypothetical protein EMCG_00442 [Emmonsia crescens UAMH 3008]